MAKKLKQHHKDRLLIVLALLLLALLLLWWLAAHYHWGPYKLKATTPTTSAVKKSSGSKSSGGSGGSSTNGSNGTNGKNGTNGSNGSSSGSTPAGANTPIFNLYGSTHYGETKSEVAASAGGLSPNCIVSAKSTSSPGGRQEVCTYSEGDKVVTITYLDDNVATVTKSGF